MNNLKDSSEQISTSKVLTIDEAIQRKGVVGPAAEEFKSLVVSKQDDLFKDIMCIVFGWKLQPDGSKKLVAKLPNGKIIFPDRSEQGAVEPGVPYICLVYEREREAFAKVCSEEYQPKIYIQSNRIVTMVWRDQSGKVKNKVAIGNSFEERIAVAIKEMEEQKLSSVKVVYRANQLSG